METIDFKVNPEGILHESTNEEYELKNRIQRTSIDLHMIVGFMT